MTDATQGTYLFAVARGVDPTSLDERPGLRGQPLEVVEAHGLQAVTCRVDLHEFGEAGLRRNLEDLTWVEEVARAHNEVVWRVAQQATTAPMRLVTILADHDSVVRMLEAHGASLRDCLDAVEGCREWSVKVFAVAVERSRPPEPAVASGAGSGAAYLQRKKAAAEHRRTASDQAAALGDQVHQLLSERSVASRRLAPQDPRLSGRSEPMLLNSAYLVPDEDGDAFREAVRRLGDDRADVTVELGGPWPSYSFTTLDWQ